MCVDATVHHSTLLVVLGQAICQLSSKGRIVLIAQREQEPSIGDFFTTMDARIRGLLRRHVEPLVPADRVEATVDLLRVLANGLVLTAVEHHDAWPPERQLAVLDEALSCFQPHADAR